MLEALVDQIPAAKKSDRAADTAVARNRRTCRAEIDPAKAGRAANPALSAFAEAPVDKMGWRRSRIGLWSGAGGERIASNEVEVCP